MDSQEAGKARAPHIHLYGRSKNHVCATDKLGQASPEGRSPLEIVVDASEGFVPLWARNTTLRWRFQDRSMSAFIDPDGAKNYIRTLMAEALTLWGDAVPVRFSERSDRSDFEVVMRTADDCDINGCVLASAFFPDGGRHELVLYPQMFQQSRQEQVETMIHELGHVFGLRHFFANVSETAWPSEIFGTHKRFSIMNYGSDSVLTAEDKADLRTLYEGVWKGEITNINGTPIRLMRPFSSTPPIIAPFELA
ncbi:matrixin family metalloprotease [Hwanghaeella grinnelliae]|uniref:Matrixin family metalloprotease n=2 Tax=Hwanghaeella grinnelliae TaxID=2500179 RepID=A0A3S2W8H2_9PROT|nr:matrixin family metalloprotease [Hwanghaeella grinnelliae]